MYKWYFPKKPKTKGLGHAGIETFRGSWWVPCS